MHSPGHSGIIDILARLYSEIREIEASQGLLFGGGDFRPRIDYFHDAVRALASGAPRERLTVEKLAYDVEAMRYLQSMPLASLNTQPANPKSGGRKLALREMLPVRQPPKPDRQVKQRLSELYQQYGVLFSSLFKPLADNDFHARTEELNGAMEELYAVMGVVERASGGKQALIESAAHIEDPTLRAQVIALLKSGRTQEALALMKTAKQKTDADIKKLDNAHSQYAMAQLGLYEDGKEVVKKLAASGMNLAGRFVESAMAAAARDSRGR